MSKIKVSVIIPTFNGGKYIQKSIDSVLSQTLKEFEIIVVDDGSTENIYEVLKDYIENKIILYLRQENTGPGPARKNGISHAVGEYIAFIDDDDEWIDQDKLKKQIDFLDNNRDYVMVGGAGVILYEDSNKYSDYNVLDTDELIRSRILMGNQFIQSSVVVRRTALGDLSDFPVVGVDTAEDYLLFLKLGTLGKWANFSEKMLIYRNRSGSITDKNRKKVLMNNIKIISRYKKYYPGYYKYLIVFLIKYYTFLILSLIKNESFKNKVLKILLKLYRKIVSYK